jgi:PAS domain S-box-containing protein
MKDTEKTKEQLLDELVELRRRVGESEAVEFERQQTEEALKYRLRVEKLASEISAAFVSAERAEIDETITSALENIVRFAGANRSSLFLLSDDLETITNTHEWCTSPGDSQIALLQDIPFSIFGYHREELLQHRTISISSFEDYPPTARGEREWIEEHGFRSLLFLPLLRQGKLHGTLGIYGGTGEEITWPSEFVDMLRITGNLILNTLERKQAEEALQFQAAISENIAEGIYLIGLDDGKIKYANPRFEQMFGYDEGEMIGKDVAIINAPTEKTPEEAKREIVDILGETGEWHGEVKNIKKDGTAFWCYANVSLFDHPEYGRVLISVHDDITERKQVEEQVLRKNAVLDAINRVLQEALVCESEEEVARTCLSVAEHLTGSPYGFVNEWKAAGRVDNLAISDLGWAACRMPGSEAVTLIKDMEVGSYWGRVLREGRSQIINDPDADPDRVGLSEGHAPITCFLGVPLWQGKKVFGLIGLANKEGGYDLAEQESVEALSAAFVEALLRKRAEQATQEHAVRLAAANEELEAFAYSVSHDLRTPLRSIDGFSQALQEDYAGQLDAEGKEHLHRIRAGSQRMGELIENLLNLSRVTRQKMHRETVDLSALAEQIGTRLRQTQPERQVTFEITQGLIVHGDQSLLQVVLENLLGNAWKFTSKHPRAKIKLGGTQIEGQPTYFVHDDGAGFDMTYADKLFGAFQRLHAVEEFSGTGIGLATVQRIVHRHGGRLWAEGEVENGATFYFTL